MSIYYKYAPYGEKIVVLSYVDDFVYWYTSESLGKWFVETLGNRFHVKFFGYAHWFISIRISQMKDHSILVNQARYATFIVAEYFDTSTVETSTKFYNTNFSSDIIFTKAYVYISDEQVEKMTREFNIHYRACSVSLIYLLSTRVDFSFVVHKLETFSSKTGKLNLKDWYIY